MSEPSEFQVCIVQMNPILGDIAGNLRMIQACAEQFSQQEGDYVLVFPELALTGYPPEDLLLRADFIATAARALQELQEKSKLWLNIVLVVGAPLQRQDLHDRVLVNAAAVLHQGRRLATHEKHELPNYDVFDEKRYFTPSNGVSSVFCWAGVTFALSVCEDIWLPTIMASAVSQGAQVMLNLNASPFHRGKQSLRREVLSHRLSQVPNPDSMVIVYANQVGGQDELVFDGGSMVVAYDAVLTLPRFEAGVGVVKVVVESQCVNADSILPQAVSLRVSPSNVKISIKSLESTLKTLPFMQYPDEPYQDEMHEIFQALVLGTRDYISKNGFSKVMLGLSGGIDSALTLVIAVAAVGAESVYAAMMPFDYTSSMSVEDATTQAQRLGVNFFSIPIHGICHAVGAALDPVFQDLPSDVTEENIQARSRAILLMALSNKLNGLVLTTGNKSELAVGYSTLYGDMAGGFNPIKDLPKTQVYALARYLNRAGLELGFSEQEVIPLRVIERPASAELRPDQTDQDSLPEYEVLDEILRRFIELDENPQDIINAGFDEQQVADIIRRVKLNEHKRRQAPLGVRMSCKAFGRDRRYPITARW